MQAEPMQSLLAILDKARLMVNNGGGQGYLDRVSGRQQGANQVRLTDNLCLLTRSCRGRFEYMTDNQSFNGLPWQCFPRHTTIHLSLSTAFRSETTRPGSSILRMRPGSSNPNRSPDATVDRIGNECGLSQGGLLSGVVSRVRSLSSS